MLGTPMATMRTSSVSVRLERTTTDAFQSCLFPRLNRCYRRREVRVRSGRNDRVRRVVAQSGIRAPPATTEAV